MTIEKKPFGDLPVVYQGLDEKNRECWVLLKETEKKEIAKENVAGEIDSPLFFLEFFKGYGFDIANPREITNPRGTTLFVSAAVQILEDVLHHDQLPILGQRLVVAQPVLRSQFVGRAQEGVSTCFVNIGSESIGISKDDHLEILKIWLVFFQYLGIPPKELKFVTEERVSNWGEKKVNLETIRVRYRDISIGDANFIASFPTGSGQISISDIGFGAERIRWLLLSKPYWSFLSDSSVNFDPNVLDSWNTLALLGGSGILPSNHERGYRVRKVSKELAGLIGYQRSTVDIFHLAYERWKKWIELPVKEAEAEELVLRELDRNTNALLKEKLQEQGFRDVGIDINLPKDQFIKLLRGTSVTKKVLEEILATMGYET